MLNYNKSLDDLWKNNKSRRGKNFMSITVFALMILGGAIAEGTESDIFDFEELFKADNELSGASTNLTAKDISRFNSLFRNDDGPTDTTTISNTTPATITTTTGKTDNPKRCGLRKDKICVKRAECSTARRNNPKIVIDLKMPGESGCNYLEACCYPRDTLDPIDAPNPLEFRQCGIRNVGGVFMTVKGGDVEASYAEFPWTVAILDANQKLLCNGALLSEKVVLTTATCVAPDQPFTVKAGDWDLRTDKEPLPHETRTIKKRIIHQQFSWEIARNDIALLILEEPLPLLTHIIPVCLGNGSTDLDFQNCFVSGWHVWPPNTSVATREILLKVDIDFDSPHCRSSASTELCAKTRTDRPVSASGAPLVCPTEDSKYHLVGTWSTGINGVATFTDVRKFSKWIIGQLAEHDFEI